MNLACICSDIAHGFIPTMFSIASGIKEGICEFVASPPNPVDTFIDIAYGIGHVIHFIIEGAHCLNELRLEPHEREHCIALKKSLSDEYNNLHDFYTKTPGQQKIKIATKLVTDIVLRKKFFGLLSKAATTCKNFIQTAQSLQAIDRLELIGRGAIPKDFIDIDVDGNVLNAVDKLKNAGIALMEHDHQNIFLPAIAVTPQSLRPLSIVLHELRTNGAPFSNPVFQREVLAHFQQLCGQTKTACTSLSQTIKAPFKGMMTDWEFDAQHILYPSLTFKQNHKNGLIEGFISGGHSGKVIEKLVAEKTVRELMQDPLTHGAYYAEYAHDFGSYLAKKTIFCPTWSDKKIMDEIKSAINNIIYINQSKNNTMGIMGISKSNFKIEMFIKESLNKIIVETAYPYDRVRSKFRKGL
ncbi:EndoU domain-containing protein [Candidatus Dependentiae bacterium]|nr:EndoU domain-containing protein [Candidatus Dependentiae bacterium]